MRGASFLSLFLVGLGLIFLAAGGAIGTLGPRSAREAAERAERLRPLSEAALEDAPPGREALVEGAIDPRTPPQLRDFVAYVREEYRGTDDDGRDEWVVDETRTPRLLVAVSDGAVTVEAGDYRIERAPHEWQDRERRERDGLGGGTRRYRGLRAGDAVLVLGVVAAGREGPSVAADTVYGGTRAEYVAGKRAEESFLPWFGGGFAAIGAAAAGVGAWLHARGRRALRAPRRAAGRR